MSFADDSSTTSLLRDFAADGRCRSSFRSDESSCKRCKKWFVEAISIVSYFHLHQTKCLAALEHLLAEAKLLAFCTHLITGVVSIANVSVSAVLA